MRSTARTAGRSAKPLHRWAAEAGIDPAVSPVPQAADIEPQPRNRVVITRESTRSLARALSRRSSADTVTANRSPTRAEVRRRRIV